MIEDLYKPTHVLLPVGDQCGALRPKEAALSVAQALKSCRMVILTYFKGSKSEAPEIAISELAVEHRMSNDFVTSFQQELIRMGVTDKRVIDSELEVLGFWLDLTI